jgi:hypothetical protein
VDWISTMKQRKKKVSALRVADAELELVVRAVQTVVAVVLADVRVVVPVAAEHVQVQAPESVNALHT